MCIQYAAATIDPPKHQSRLKHLCKLISDAVFRHCLTLKISTIWSLSSHCSGSLMWHVLRVSGMSGEDAVESQRLASRLLGGLTNKVQSQRVEGKKKAEEIPTGDCANDVMLTAEKRSHSSVQNKCGFKLDHPPHGDRHVVFLHKKMLGHCSST